MIIGLEKGVKFEAQRIENPDRIFFDLRDTNLPSSLLGKTFDVDDGLLKKIRVAQFQPGKSRIVLEVADRSEYTTSLLSDPPRLIIDIHGKDVQSKAAASPGSQDKKAAQPTLVVSNNPKKTVVEEGGDDDDSAVTVAKLDPPQITAAAKAPIGLDRACTGPAHTREKLKPQQT